MDYGQEARRFIIPNSGNSFMSMELTDLPYQKIPVCTLLKYSSQGYKIYNDVQRIHFNVPA